MKKSAEKYSCEYCSFYANKLCDWDRHLSTRKHKNSTIFNEKTRDGYLCTLCNTCHGNKYDLYLHNLTPEHKKKIKIELNPVEKPYKCDICEKEYKTTNSLWYHKKKCTTKPKEDTHKRTNSLVSLMPQDYNVMVELIKQNNDLQKQVIEMSKEPKIVNSYNTTASNNTNTTNSNNTNNNQFNLNFFLNETCKNAINFSEFIDNIQVSYDDLENNAKMGFVSGMTKIIVDNLKQLELNDRPIHCTDVKRETIYVKEEDQWEKDQSKEVIQKGIQELTRKNMCQLSEWREENPEYNDFDSDLSELSIVMQQHSMAGAKREEFYPKIIKNLAKETTVDKSTGLKIV